LKSKAGMSLSMCSLQKRPPKSRLARLASLDGLSRCGLGVGPKVARPSRPCGDRREPERRPRPEVPKTCKETRFGGNRWKSEKHRNEPTKCHPIDNMTLDRTQIEPTPKPLSGLEWRTVLARTHFSRPLFINSYSTITIYNTLNTLRPRCRTPWTVLRRKELRAGRRGPGV